MTDIPTNLGIVQVLHAVAIGDVFTITRVGESAYQAHDSDGVLVMTSRTPKALSKLLMEAGAQRVKHDYNLVYAEDGR
jgi:hypothetical protein